MNLKHEMFWNFDIAWFVEFNCLMNLKHEMFWNSIAVEVASL